MESKTDTPTTYVLVMGAMRSALSDAARATAADPKQALHVAIIDGAEPQVTVRVVPAAAAKSPSKTALAIVTPLPTIIAKFAAKLATKAEKTKKPKESKTVKTAKDNVARPHGAAATKATTKPAVRKK